MAKVAAPVGELPYMLWLLIRDVDGDAWRNRVGQ
jgi:hypothetical protein